MSGTQDITRNFVVNVIRGKVTKDYESQSKKCRFYSRQWRF